MVNIDTTNPTFITIVIVVGLIVLFTIWNLLSCIIPCLPSCFDICKCISGCCCGCASKCCCDDDEKLDNLV